MALEIGGTYYDGDFGAQAAANGGEAVADGYRFDATGHDGVIELTALTHFAHGFSGAYHVHFVGVREIRMRGYWLRFGSSGGGAAPPVIHTDGAEATLAGMTIDGGGRGGGYNYLDLHRLGAMTTERLHLRRMPYVIINSSGQLIRNCLVTDVGTDMPAIRMAASGGAANRVVGLTGVDPGGVPALLMVDVTGWTLDVVNVAAQGYAVAVASPNADRPLAEMADLAACEDEPDLADNYRPVLGANLHLAGTLVDDVGRLDLAGEPRTSQGSISIGAYQGADMGSYITTGYMTGVMPERDLVELTDDEGVGRVDETVLASIVDQAEGEANSYLAKRYAAPVDLDAHPDVAATLRVHVAAIVIYRLHRRRSRVPDDVRTDYEDARRWLRDAAAGKVTLGDESAPTASGADGTVEAGGQQRKADGDSLASL